jgi:hypothetical protein
MDRVHVLLLIYKTLWHIELRKLALLLTAKSKPNERQRRKLTQYRLVQLGETGVRLFRAESDRMWHVCLCGSRINYPSSVWFCLPVSILQKLHVHLFSHAWDALGLIREQVTATPGGSLQTRRFLSSGEESLDFSIQYRVKFNVIVFCVINVH